MFNLYTFICICFLGFNTTNIAIQNPQFHKEPQSNYDLEDTFHFIQRHFKKNSTNTFKVDLKGIKLLVYHKDGSYCEFDLNIVSDIKSEYNSGKYYLEMKVDSKSTFLERDEINIIYCYDSQGILETKSVGVGVPFNTYQNAVIARDAVRRLQKMIKS